MNNNLKINGPKVGLFSDIHIGLGKGSSVWHENVLEFAQWTADFYKKRKITEIIIPGDIFHYRDEISVNTLNTAKQFFDIFKNFKLFISTGNHDCYYKDRSDVNSISLLAGWDNITLIDKEPQIFNIHNSNKTLSLIPWGVSASNIPKTDICVGHFEIISFKMNTYKVCDHGDDSTDFFVKSPFIISGHFHNKQYREYSRGKIMYLGSPYQQNFGDSGNEHGIYVLDLITEEFEFIPNKISPTHEKVSLKEIINGNINTTFLKKVIPNNMISFVIDANYPTEKLMLLTAKLQNLKPKFFRLEYQSIDNTMSITEGEVDYNTFNITQNLQDFVNALDTPYKNETFNYLNDIYQKLTV